MGGLAVERSAAHIVSLKRLGFGATNLVVMQPQKHFTHEHALPAALEAVDADEPAMPSTAEAPAAAPVVAIEGQAADAMDFRLAAHRRPKN